MRVCDQYQTPFYVIHEKDLNELTEQLLHSYNEVGWHGMIGYSIKTNNLPWLIEFMKNKGFCAEAVSSDELLLARNLGYDFRNIIFNGPVKGKDEFIEAVENGAVVNIDSFRELDWLLLCNRINGRIGLRVNFDLEKVCPGETQCGMEDGRFGFSYEKGDVRKALFFLEEHHIKLSGLHLHCSSKTRSLNVYEAIANIAVEIVRNYGLHLNFLDIGGGFFGGVEEKPSFKDYFSKIDSILKQEPFLNQIDVIIEPGISLIGAPIDYVTTVIDIRETLNNRFIQIDGSRIHVDPLMKKNSYTYSVQSSEADHIINQKQTICGFTCMENDRLFQIENGLELHIDDRIVFQKVGAYTMGLSPLFIQFYPDVLVENTGDVECVRHRISAGEMVRLGNSGY